MALPTYFRSRSAAVLTIAVTALVGLSPAPAMAITVSADAAHIARNADTRPNVPQVGPGRDDKRGHDSFTVIGDLPYGADELAALPRWVDTINASKSEFTVHVGDLKSGSQRCDTSYFQTIRSQFDRFRNPLILTPGDNDWTDCHRINNGAYDPLERLSVIRALFYPKPGVTLGQKPMKVTSQADRGLPENVSFRQSGIDFATLHVVGSNDDLQPWAGIGNAAATPQQVEEERSRMAGAIDQVTKTIATATKKHDRAVAFFLQADMFDPTYTPTSADIGAFTPLVQALVDAASTFDGEVYLFNGDSHIYNSDQPLAPGSIWLSRYGVTGSTTNLTRVTVDGSDNAGKDYLYVTVNRPGAAHVLSWERLPYAS